MKTLYALLGLLVMIFVIIFILIFHRISTNLIRQKAEQEQQAQEWAEQAGRNAQDYISEKYGFQAEVISTEQDWSSGMFAPQRLSDYLVKMQYQNKIFDVSITGINANTDGYDSYQTEEILNHVQNECEKAVSGVYNVGVNRGEFEFSNLESEALFSAYFDGSNAPELLQNSRIFVRYIQTDLSGMDLSVMKNSPDFRRFQDILFISYRSEELLQNCPERWLYRYYEGYAVYFDNIYEFCRKEENYCRYEIGQCGNLCYYVPDGSPEDVKVSETEPDAISNWKVSHFPETEYASRAWKIEAGKETDVIVFVPKSEISGSGIREAVRRNTSYTDEYLGDVENFTGVYLTPRFHIRPNEEFHFLYLKR